MEGRATQDRGVMRPERHARGGMPSHSGLSAFPGKPKSLTERRQRVFRHLVASLDLRIRYRPVLCSTLLVA